MIFYFLFIYSTLKFLIFSEIFSRKILSAIRLFVGASSVVIPDEEVMLFDAIFAEADRLGIDLDAHACEAIDWYLNNQSPSTPMIGGGAAESAQSVACSENGTFDYFTSICIKLYLFPS